MGAICACENSSSRVFTDSELAKIIKIQSMIRVKIAKNTTKSLKALHSSKANNLFRKLFLQNSKSYFCKLIFL